MKKIYCVKVYNHKLNTQTIVCYFSHRKNADKYALRLNNSCTGWFSYFVSYINLLD